MISETMKAVVEAAKREGWNDAVDAIVCVKQGMCSTGMPLPCHHQDAYDELHRKYPSAGWRR